MTKPASPARTSGGPSEAPAFLGPLCFRRAYTPKLILLATQGLLDQREFGTAERNTRSMCVSHGARPVVSPVGARNSAPIPPCFRHPDIASVL